MIPIEDAYWQGHVSLEKSGGAASPWRLPFDQLRLFPPEEGLQTRAHDAAGVRLRFATTASELTLRIEPVDGRRLFDLVIANEVVQTVEAPAGAPEVRFTGLPGDERQVAEIWMPQAHPVKVHGFEVPAGASIRPAEDDRPRWITYGSSISQCAAAHSPARIWSGVAARRLNLHLTCLGYGGNCHIEPMLARMIRGMPADYISLKLGINVYGSSSLSGRTFRQAIIGFVSIVREGHPHTPMAVISPVVSPTREQTANAVGLTLARMRELVQDAVLRLQDAGDKRLIYVDGLSLFDHDDAERYLPDGLHPNGDGYALIGERFAERVFPRLERLGA